MDNLKVQVNYTDTHRIQTRGEIKKISVVDKKQ